MPRGGLLTIRVASATYADVRERVPNAIDTDYVLVSVTDTGMGMDKDVQKRIFDPFFTTKERGKGTGLGLAIVHGIVRCHSGYIDVESEKEKGTCFTLYFPAVHDPMMEIEESAIAPIEGGDESILFVEDEAALRDGCIASLKKYGYNVLSARNGREALQLFKKNFKTVSLVITDLDMPVMGGEELCRKLVELDPRVSIVLITGFLEYTSKKALRARRIHEVIIKPFTQETLMRTIRNVIESETKPK
jgi:CheY-like chemotaxis protein